MANRGGLDDSIIEALGKDHQQMFVAVKAEFDTATLRFHTSEGDISIGGETYEGLGTLLSIENIKDSTELKSEGITVSLAGMDATVLDYALTENYQNRIITVLMGYSMGGTNEIMGTVVLFKGRMQKMTIHDDPAGSTIQVNAENRLIDLSRPSNMRFTRESQRYIDEDDTCFDSVASLQDKEIVWGKSSNVGGGGTGTGNSGHSPGQQMR